MNTVNFLTQILKILLKSTVHSKEHFDSISGIKIYNIKYTHIYRHLNFHGTTNNLLEKIEKWFLRKRDHILSWLSFEIFVCSFGWSRLWKAFFIISTFVLKELSMSAERKKWGFYTLIGISTVSCLRSWARTSINLI